MKKRKLLENYQEKIGEHYFELLQFTSVINIIKEELNCGEKINNKIEEIIDLLKEEADKILEEDVE